MRTRKQRLLAGHLGTMAVGAATSLLLLAAGFLTAVVVMGTVTTPGNPNPQPAPSLPVCYRLTDDSCAEGLWVNVEDMPTDPYEGCIYLLMDIPTRIGRPGFAPEVCEGVGEQRG